MDLHIHTTKSDGELTPEEIVQEAVEARLSMIAITDHDQIAGYHVAKPHAEKAGIRLIPGIELNTDGEDGELHILGYNFDPHAEALDKYIAWRTEDRKQWARNIVKKLNELDYDTAFDACAKRATGGIIVRTHIADELVSKGYFPNSKEAYTSLLQKGGPAFLKRSVFTAEDAINLIHSIGGEAYLAHPGIYPFEMSIEKLVSYGLDGVEVFHSKHTREQTASYEKLAEQLNLKISGGSDHHGPNSRNPFPVGSVRLSDACITQWKEEVFRT
ncbi:PHP domain-containing protein [Oceanobacillus kapialis]|uniref:PHP domain-containing protein n=1 Tax=Oceanobacillus kapialis TaxID=481353 RepID=A0ABW5Q329_9BACI